MDDLTLTARAQDGVALLERAAEHGDPGHYNSVQAALLEDTPKGDPGEAISQAPDQVWGG